MNSLKHFPSIKKTIPSLFQNEADFDLIPSEYVEEFKKWEVSYITKKILEKKSKDRLYIQFSGIPCSGKNFYLENDNGIKYNNNFLVIEADKIMFEIPFYKIEEQAGLSKKDLFNHWEIPARIISYKLLLKAIGLGINIVHNTGGFASVNIEILKYAKSIGYCVKHIHFEVTEETALKRLNRRNKLSTKFTPVEYLKERQIEIKKLLPSYLKIADESIVVGEN